MGREQFADLSNFHGGQTGQHVGESYLGVETTPAVADQYRVDHRAVPSGLRMADEEPLPAAHRNRPKIILDQIVIDLKASILEVPVTNFARIGSRVTSRFESTFEAAEMPVDSLC